MTAVTIASWNLHQAVDKRPANVAATWRFLAEEIQPSVALLQEVAEAADAADRLVFSQADNRGYATAVAAFEGHVVPLGPVKSRYSSRIYDLQPRVPATFAAGRVVDIPEVDPFVAVSLYGLLEGGYAQTNFLRALADLIPLIDAPKYGRRLVLGGDLNSWDQELKDRRSVHRWRAIFAFMESLGLVNLLKLTQPVRGPLVGCPCQLADCWHVETYRVIGAWQRGEPSFWTLDYMFATKELADRLTDLEIWNSRADAWALSDHCPLVARFDL